MIAGYTLVVGTAFKDSSGNLLTGTLSFQPVLNNGTKTNFRAGQAVSAPAAFNSGTTYAQGQVVTGADSNVYVSLVAGNTGHAPVTLGTGGAANTYDAVNWMAVPAGCLSSGQTSNRPIEVTVTTGAFAVILPDTSLTFPQDIGFAVTGEDSTTGDCTLGQGYNCFQPTTAIAQNASANANGVVSFDAYDPNLAPQVTVQTGPQGLSAYQEWVGQGNTGSEADFLASLVGTVSSTNGVTFASTGDAIAPDATQRSSVNWSVRDAFRRLALWVSNAGDTNIEGALNANGNATFKGTLTVLGSFVLSTLQTALVNFGSSNTIGTSTDRFGSVWRIKDVAGYVALRLSAAGRLLVGGGLDVKQGMTVAGGATFDALTVNGSTVRTYTAKPTRSIIGLGQSNMEAWSASPIFNLRPSRYNLMFAPTGINDKFQTTLKTGLIPLQERYYELEGDGAPGFVTDAGTQFECGETGLTIMADALSLRSSIEDGFPTRWIVSTAAQGGYPLSLMGSGSDVDTRFQNQVTAGKAFGGAGYNLFAFVVDHGEADNTSTTYATDYASFIAAKAAEAVAITGQSNTPLAVAVQQSSTGDTTVSPQVMRQPYELLQACRAHPTLLFCSGPMYDINTTQDSTQHNGNTGNYRKGLRYARALRGLETADPTSTCLCFSQAVISGNLIRVDFNVPRPPIVLDQTLVQAIANYGLEYTDDGNSVTTPTITGVYVRNPTAQSGGTVVSLVGSCLFITLSAAPGSNTNPMVSAAWTFPSGGDPTVGTGPRTNIRDSDTRLSDYAPNLFNWMCHDRVAVTAGTP